MSRVGDKINRMRTSKGMTQKELAKAIGATEKFVIEVEAGKKVINDDLLKRIVKVLGQDTQELMMYEANPGVHEEKEEKPVKKAQPKEVQKLWYDAFDSILKTIPIYEYNLSSVVGTKQLPIVENKVEGHAKEKVIYLQIRDNDMIGFRIAKGDIAFGTLNNEVQNNSICLVEYGGQRVVRQVKRLDNEKLLLVSNNGTLATETVSAKELKVLARLERVEFKI